MTLGKASQASAVALALMFGAGLALFGPSAASASVLPAQTAAVLSASATPAQLPATGGTVTVTARVANATSCQLQLLSSQSFTVVYSHNPKDCSADYSARVTIGPNTTAVTRTVAFGLEAHNAASGSASRARLYLYLAAGAPGQIVTNTSAPPTTTVPGTVPPAPVNDEESSNWSGYSSTGGPFTVAKGTFTVRDVAAR